MAISAADVQQAREELRAIYESLWRSIDEADASWADRYLDDRFVYVDHTGTVRDIETYKAMYDTIPPGYVGVHDFTEFDVELLGDGTVALVRGAYHARMEFTDRTVEENLRLAAVWERQNDEWKRIIDQTVSYVPE